jgi:hypothetical protein
MAAKIKYTTARGLASYPWLNKPDTQFSDDGVYSCQLRVAKEAAMPLCDFLTQTASDEFGAKVKAKMPFTIDAETNEVIFKTKSKFPPKFFDATGEPIAEGTLPRIWGGSELCLGGIATPYTVSGSKGISLQLTRVQVINPVSGNQGDNAGGFDAVEGGYKANGHASLPPVHPKTFEGADEDGEGYNF